MPFEKYRLEQQGLLLAHIVAGGRGLPLYSVVLLSMAPANSVRVRLLLPGELMPGLPRLLQGPSFKVKEVGEPGGEQDAGFWTLVPEAGWSLEILLHGTAAVRERENV